MSYLSLLKDAIEVINAHQDPNEGDALAKAMPARNRLDMALGTDCHGAIYEPGILEASRDEDMGGVFVCKMYDGLTGVYRARAIKPGKGPTVEDIARSYEPIQKANQVLFIGDNGEIWLMKDRWLCAELPQRLR